MNRRRRSPLWGVLGFLVVLYVWHARRAEPAPPPPPPCPPLLCALEPDRPCAALGCPLGCSCQPALGVPGVGICARG